MSGFTPFAFTDTQLVDIRRFCGYPARADGNVLFPAPWVNVQYLALEYRIAHLAAAEAAVVVNYLATLNMLETAITAASTTLNVDSAAAFKRNAKEMDERNKLFDGWRKRLCGFLGIKAGPDFAGSSNSFAMVV